MKLIVVDVDVIVYGDGARDDASLHDGKPDIVIDCSNCWRLQRKPANFEIDAFLTDDDRENSAEDDDIDDDDDDDDDDEVADDVK